MSMMSNSNEVDDGRIPRIFEDPVTRGQIVALLKSGMSLMDTLRLLGYGHLEGSIRREWDNDPEFYDECIEAMKDPFEPALRKALKLAESADVAGENEGAHKALALVMRTYDRILDRKTKVQLGLRAAEAVERGAGRGNGNMSFVIGPEAVQALVEGISGERRREAIETTTYEEGHDDG